MNEPPSMSTSIPDDVLLDILARVPRSNYPTLSLVSKHFQSLVTSPEVYSRRSLLSCTENFLYVLVRGISSDRLYILHQKALVHISSLSDIPFCDSFVGVGSRIYMFGGVRDVSSSAFSIDCRSHTVQPIPNMPIPMTCTVADVMDSKIYVFGHCSMKSTVMVVFDTRTQMWEPGLINPDIVAMKGKVGSMVVMADKIYIKYDRNSYVYVPKETKWETNEMLNSKDWDANNPCVVDDVLYYYEWYENCLRMYDPKQKCCGVVKGLDELFAEIRHRYWLDIACFGRKLALYFCEREGESESRTTRKIWCAEISLKRREGGMIWGKVDWCDQVMAARKYEDYTIYVSVMV